MKIHRLIVGLCLSVSLYGCVPWVSNVARLYHPVGDASQYFQSESKVLVLPVWDESDGECNIRSPFVLPVSSLFDLHKEVRPRRMLGMMGFDGHGPDHYRGITGFIVVGAEGRVVWTEQREARHAGILSAPEFTSLVFDIRNKSRKSAFERLQGRRTNFPGILCENEPIGLEATKSERVDVLKYIDPEGSELSTTSSHEI